MSSRDKKSIVDLVNQTMPDTDQVNKAIKQIHKQSIGQSEKMVRVSVDTPESLHRELKKLVIDQGIGLKEFYLEAVVEKMKRSNEETLT